MSKETDNLNKLLELAQQYPTLGDAAKRRAAYTAITAAQAMQRSHAEIFNPEKVDRELAYFLCEVGLHLLSSAPASELAKSIPSLINPFIQAGLHEGIVA